MKIHYLLLTVTAMFLGLAHTNAQPKKSANASKKSSSATKLTIIGEVESISFLKQNVQLDARIDTGATTSSLRAINIEHYERDGKKWVRFEMPTTKDPKGKWIKVERPLARIIPVKRHGAEPLHRPVVSMLVSIGDIKCHCEFSLTDRKGFEYPVLIGRNFLSGRALVDVSQNYLANPINKEKSNEN